MKRYKVRLFLFVVAVLMIMPAWAAMAQSIEVNEKGEVVEPFGQGGINWTTRRVEAIGRSSPNQDAYAQVRAAEINARAELLRIIDGVRIRGSYGVAQGKLIKDITEEQVEGFLRYSRVGKPYKNDALGLMEVKASIQLDEHGTAVLMPEKVALKTENKPYQPPAPVTPAPIKYTGLILDARGLGAKPAMAPRILCEGSLAEVYGPLAADSDVVLSQGFAGYAGTPEKARTMLSRIGDRPLEIKARGTSNVTDLVISQDDAQKLAGAVKTSDFLRECKVVIVVN
jgi:hypothetical protein